MTTSRPSGAIMMSPRKSWSGWPELGSFLGFRYNGADRYLRHHVLLWILHGGPMKILGLDPGLGTTGWGLIDPKANRLSHLANGQIKTDTAAPLPRRLAALADQLEALISDHAPEAAAVEEVFVNQNAQSTLKLGQA